GHCIDRSHRGGFERRDLVGVLIGHRHSLDKEDKATDEGCGQEQIDDHSPHIEEEVTQARIASESSNDRRESTQADSRGEEKHRDAKEDLSEIRKRDVPRVILDVRIRDERDNGVKDRARRQHPEATRIKRHPRLQRQDDVAIDEQDCVEDEQRYRVLLLPVLRPAIEMFLEPSEDSRRLVLAVHDLRHVTAYWDCNYYREYDYGDWQKPHRP